MNRLFDIDGPVMGFLTKIVYSVYLNILWLLCCLPIVTAGASTTALYYVTLKMAKNEEGNVTRSFFRSFKENFRQATVIWLILLALGVILGLDGYVFYHMRFHNAVWTIGTAVFTVAVAAYLIVLMYIFPLLARFENTTRAMFRNAIMIGMRFLLCTALMAAIHFAMGVVIVRIFTPAVIFGEGLCALLCSYFLSNILALCEGPREAADAPDGADTKEEPEQTEDAAGPRDLHGKKKLEYIWDYYKLPIFAACLALYIAGYLLYGHFTHKDTILYTALVNIDAGENLLADLEEGFLEYANADPSDEKLELYRGLYLGGETSGADYGYTSASGTKIVASIDRECLDVVLMNKEAFDAFCENGYLLNIETFLREHSLELYGRLQKRLVTGTAVLEDNAQMDPDVSHSVQTDEYPMGVDLSDSPVIQKAGFQDAVYLGVIANTPRTEMVLSYLEYLYAQQ